MVFLLDIGMVQGRGSKAICKMVRRIYLGSYVIQPDYGRLINLLYILKHPDPFSMRRVFK
jgi:hypothetical protein